MSALKFTRKLSVTFLFLLELATGSFGSPAAVASPSFTLEDFKGQFSQNAAGHFLLEIPMIFNTALDPEVRTVVSGCSVETCGQISSDSIYPGAVRRFRVTRSQIHCCAVHAREYSVLLSFEGTPPALQELAWVRLSGTLSYVEEDGKRAAMILVKEIVETSKPQNPLLQ